MNKLNRLKGLCGYLCGPIDFAKDAGRDWREDMEKFIEPMGVRVFNPLKPAFYGQAGFDDVRRPQIEAMRKEGRYSELRDEIKSIVHWDLRQVDLSSFLVVNYDPDIPMAGTYEEVFKASLQVKPVLLMIGEDKNRIAKWMFGRFPDEHMFASWEEIKKYLESINSNPYHIFTEADEKRWLFFDGEHINNEYTTSHNESVLEEA